MIVSQKIFIKISQKTNGRCFYCNKDGEHIDHFISKNKWKEWDLTRFLGSVDDITNLFLACAKCNLSKNNKDPEDFMRNSNKNYSKSRNSKNCWDRHDRANKRITLKT